MRLKKIILVFILSAFILLANTNSIFPFSKYELYCNNNLLILSGEIAMSQNGIIEKNNNRGEVLKYSSIFSSSLRGLPYCASGVYWTFYIASNKLNIPLDSIPIPKTMVADAIFRYAKANGIKKKYQAEINDLIVWRKKSNYRGHIERIIKVGEKGNVTTIAFNTSSLVNGKKVEGVFIKKRNIYHPIANLAIRGLIGFRTDAT